MSIKVPATHAPLRPAGMEMWGEVGPEGDPNPTIRFVLSDRTVCFPTSEIKRWEHIRSTPERLILVSTLERITVTGRDLTDIRCAMDRNRLREVRVAPSKAGIRIGPQIDRIEFESLRTSSQSKQAD